jgi:hypothetical protein
MRILLNEDGNFQHKTGYRLTNIREYKAGEEYDIRIQARISNRYYEVYINGEKAATGLFFTPVHELAKITFRSGKIRRFPDTDTPTDQDYDVGYKEAEPEAVYMIKYLITRELKALATTNAE